MNDFVAHRALLVAVTGLCIVLCTKPIAAQVVTSIVPDGKPHTFAAREKQFFIDGQPTMLVAGEMHFGRVLPEDWDRRLKQAKAMGLNTVSFYLFWHMCEPREGEFQFTGMTDVRRMLKLCQENGLWAILRPGPYCCAEIEYGGIPWWTLKHPEVKIRSSDPQWLAWCRRYLEQVYKQVGDLEVSKGGPLVMVQIDNEIGITQPPNNDYMLALTKIFKEVGFGTQLFTCDPGARLWTDERMRIPGVLHGRNGLKDDRAARETVAAIGDFPVFVPEVYTAWFSGWGDQIAKQNSTIPQVANWLTYLLDREYSFCLYMFFGGTTFGFDNGCNQYLPVQTSYDYSAPIDEAGRTTEKYQALRELFATRLKINPPSPPPEPAVVELPPIRLNESQPLLATLPSKPTLTFAKPVSMENLDQAYGCVLYRKKFENGIKGTLELRQALDYAIVMINGRTVAKSFRGYGPESSKIELSEAGEATLDILVYNLGRISVIVSDRTQDRARKGLIGGAFLDGEELNEWDIYSLPLTDTPFTASNASHSGPTFYRGTFEVNDLGGTFLDMRNWSMGAVWVNGHNLGRFWDRGGQRSLFLPSHWLKAGRNDIVVLEFHDAPETAEVSSSTKLIEERPVPFSVRLDRGTP
jgi:beta-galactosidase